MSCFTGVPVKGTYHDKTTVFCYLLDVTSATDFPVINSITVLLASIAVNTPARMKMAPRYPISVSFSCRKMKEKIAAKIGSREDRNPVFIGVDILLHNSLYNESVS